MKRFIFILMITGLVATNSSGQNYKIGVKAGLNYFKFKGPLEPAGNETYGLSSGFHFGVNFTYYLSDFVGFRSELLYNQKGSKQDYDGNGYTIIKQFDDDLILYGNKDLSMQYSLSYVTIPLTVVVNPISKLEISAGVHVDLMIGPQGSGNYIFTGDNDVSFRRSLQHRYRNDDPGSFNFNLPDIIIDVDGELVSLNKSIGAYYYYDEVDGNRFNSFDVGLNAGFAYYINKGLYFGGQFSYGLLDLTQTQFDVSLEELNDDNSFITRTDNDTQLGFQLSIGFRF